MHWQCCVWQFGEKNTNLSISGYCDRILLPVSYQRHIKNILLNGGICDKTLSKPVMIQIVTSVFYIKALNEAQI